MALANADGLLGDDEYRVLRQTMFEQVASSQSAPTESKYQLVPRVETLDDRMGDRGERFVFLRRVALSSSRGFPFGFEGSGSSTARSCADLASDIYFRDHPSDNARTPTARNNNGHNTTSRPSSTHSSSSRSKLSALGSFFRKKPSHHNLHDNQARSSSSRRESSSLFSSNSSSAPGRGSISHTSLLQVPGDRNRDSRFGSTSTVNPSIKSGRTARTALTDATFEGSRPSSLFSMNSKASTSAPPSAFHLRALHSTSSDAGGVEALPGAEATPAEVRAEIASVEAEGRRLVAAFDGLEEAAFRDAEGGFVSVDDARGGGVGGGDDWTVVSNPLPSSLHHHKPQPTPLKPALKNSASASSAGRRTSIASSFTTPSHSHSSSIASPSSFLLNNSSTPASSPSTLSRKLSRINPSTSSTSTGTNHSSFSPSTSTSAGTSLLSRSTSSATTRGGRASVDRALPSLPRATADDPEAAALEATVLDLRRRKKDAEERYQRRLEFLKGKLRAAELKERAMR